MTQSVNSTPKKNCCVKLPSIWLIIESDLHPPLIPMHFGRKECTLDSHRSEKAQ